MTSGAATSDPQTKASGGGALAGITVLDCASSITAPFTCQLLRGFGAEVIKVEDPASGDELRGRGPFLHDDPGPDAGGLFQYVNAAKFGISLSLETASGRALLHRLAEQADVLVDDRTSEAAQAAGLDFETLHAVNPALIVASITPFGHTGPWADNPGTDLTIYHASGLGYATPGLVEDPDTQAPLRAGSYQASFTPALGATINLVAAILARDLSSEPEGSYIDFSCFEASTNVLRQGLGSYAFEGSGLGRRLSRGRGAGGTAQARNIRCKDGSVQLWVAGQRQWEALRELMGNPEWMDDERAGSSVRRGANWPFIVEHLEAWTTQYGKQELFFLCQGRGITCAPVQDGEEVLHSGVFESRDFWDEIDLGDEARLRVPGPLIQMSATPLQRKARAPRLGEHNVAVYGERLGLPREELARLKHSGVI